MHSHPDGRASARPYAAMEQQQEGGAMTSISANTQEQGRRQVQTAVASILCALAIGLGLAAWQGRQPSGQTAHAPLLQGQTANVTAAHPGNRADQDIAADGPLGNVAPAQVGEPGVASSIYLVGTRAAAEAVQLGANATVVVIASAEDEARLLATVANADAVNAERGLPGIQVVDLRASLGDRILQAAVHLRRAPATALPG